MLCFRCEHRARHMSDHDYQPRMECGEVHTSKGACYMFLPCLPVVTRPLNPKDRRPRFGAPVFSQREAAERVLDPEKDKLCLGIIWKRAQEAALAWEKKA